MKKTLDFKKVRTMISQCSTIEKGASLSEKFKFSIDIEKLDKKLENSNFYVIALNKKIQSHVPTAADLQMITEYTYDKKLLRDIFNGDSEVAELILFTTNRTNSDEPVTFLNDDGETLTRKDIYTLCNDPENLDEDLIKSIAIEFPIFRILFVRCFNEKFEKFEYRIYIRSNHEMIELHASESADDAEEKVEE